MDSFTNLSNRLTEIEKRLDKIEGKREISKVKTIEFSHEYVEFKDKGGTIFVHFNPKNLFQHQINKIIKDSEYEDSVLMVIDEDSTCAREVVMISKYLIHLHYRIRGDEAIDCFSFVKS